MAATTEQKVDFLLKKIGYVASKTGIAEDENSLSGTKKAPFAEAIPSPLVTPSTSIWADASLIPATPPGSDTSYVRVYLTGTSGVRMTVDNTVSGNRTFIARSTYGNDSSAILGDWIDTSFGADYIIKVFKGDPNSGGVQLSAAGAGSNDTWFFDYSSGVLNFNGTQIPSGVTSSNIYIVGYRYIGAKGGRPAAGIATFASLDVSGISTFRDDVNFISANGNNILFDKSDNALEFGDSVSAVFGTDDDGSIKHTGTNLQIFETTGNIQITNYANDKDVVISSDDGSGGTASYFKADGSTGQVELYHYGTKRFETTSTGAQVTGNLNVTGVLTYDDVTNIDSLGIVTARTGVDVNAGGINVDGGGLNIVGVSTFANNIDANGDLDVDGHTNLDNVSIAGVTTFADGVAAKFGSDGDLSIDHNGSAALIQNTTGNLTIRDTNGGIFIEGKTNQKHIVCIADGSTELYEANVKKLETTTTGINVTGNVVSDGLVVDGNTDLNGDIDVDGHTELDNVNISGLTTAALLNVNNLTDGRVTYASASGRLVDSANLTFDGTDLIAASAKITDLTSGRVVTAGTNGALQDSANLTFNGSLLDVTGNLAVSGNVSIAGTLTYQDVTNVDSVGIATARVGIKVLAGGVEIDGGGLDVQAGVSTFAGNIDANGDLDVDGHTDLDNVSIAGVTTFASNIIANGNIDLAGDIDVDGHTNLDNISIAGVTTVANDTYFTLGSNATANRNLRIRHNSSSTRNEYRATYQDFFTTDLRIHNIANNAHFAYFWSNQISLFANGSERLQITGSSVKTLNAEFLVEGDTKRLFLRDTRGTGNTARPGIWFEDSAASKQFFIGNGSSSDTHLEINNRTTGDLIFKTFPSGSQIERLRIKSGGNIQIPADNVKLQIGASQDFELYHNGSNSYIKNNTGTIVVNGSTNINSKNDSEYIAQFTEDGAVSLYYDSTRRFQTSGIGVTVTGETKTTTLNVTGITTTNNLNVTGTATIASIGSTVGISSNFYFGDDNRINMGDGDDLIIYHQSSSNDSIIQENGSGNLKIAGDNLYLTNAALSKSYLVGTNGGSVQIRHNNISKLETTVGGISVTGTTDTDNFVNAGVSTFVGIITASAVGNVIPFLFNNYSDLPAASSYHGAFAHVHTVAKGFFAHAGNWVEIVSKEADGRVGSGTETYNIKDLNVVGVSTFNNHVNLLDNDQLRIGTSADLGLYHDGSNSYIVDSGTGSLYIRGADVEIGTVGGNKYFVGASSVSKIYHLNAEKFTTKVWGVEITGTTDMDGLVVSGVSTFAGGSFSGDISAVNGTFSGNVSIAGTLTYQDVTNIDSVGIVTARTDLHVGTGATVIKTVNGQVGINSTIPAHMLDVGGVINSSTDVRVNNESLVTQNQALNDAVAMAIALG